MAVEQQVAACPLCRGARFRTFGVNPDFAGTAIRRCRACGYMSTSPTPRPDHLSDAYRSQYRETRREAPTAEHLAFKDARAAAQKACVLRHAPDLPDGPRAVLDIGCAAGSLLLAFASPGATLVGFEPDVQMSEVARSRLPGDAQVHNELFDPERFDDATFDVVTGSHVLEHVPDPLAFLEHLLRITRPGGVLFLEVPNESTVTVGEIVRADHKGLLHLHFFTPSTLEAALALAGWELLHVVTAGPTMDEFSVVPVERGHWKRRLRRNGTRVRNRILRKLGVRGRPHPEIDWVTAYSDERPRDGIWLRAVARRP